jgi:hypothetical protein
MSAVSVPTQVRQVTYVKVRNWLLAALTVSSGAVDVISFLALGKIFTAFMTGNIAFLGMGIAGHPGAPRIVSVLASMAGFAGGIYIATKIVRPSSQSAARGGEQPAAAVWPQRTTVSLGISLLPHLCFLAIWALVITSAERASDFARPAYILGTGESVETPLISQMEDFSTSRAFRISGQEALRSAEITTKDVDHLMVYDAFAHLPLFGLEDLGFCERGEAAFFIKQGATAPGGKLPMNTNGGGLSYMHSGMYGMYALQESVRQVRGIAAAQVPNVKISVTHGVGGMFAASSTIVFGKDRSS